MGWSFLFGLLAGSSIYATAKWIYDWRSRSKKEILDTAKSHLDICVFLITSEELTKILLHLFSKGVFIRIIVDKQMNEQAINSKICIFIKEHIPIKLVSGGEMMHNKFVIIDQKVLVTGSFNWTKQATTLNYENGVVIHNAEIVKRFSDYFKEIWFSPARN